MNLIPGVLAALLCAPAHAATYSLAWNIPAYDDRITGYEINYGGAPGERNGLVLIPGYGTAEAEVNVPDGAQFLAIRSVGDELYSDFSNELLVGADPAPAPTWGHLYIDYDAAPDPLYTYDFEVLTADAENVTVTSGLIGNAGYFNGSNSRVNMPNLDIEGESLSIKAHVSPEAAAVSDARIVSKAIDTSEAGHWWMLSLFSPNTVRFRLKAGGTTSTLIGEANALVPGTWYQVKATYDGAFMKLFVDGVEVGSLAKTGTIDTDPTVPVMIGSQPQGYGPFLGGIDEVKIYAGVAP